MVMFHLRANLLYDPNVFLTGWDWIPFALWVEFESLRSQLFFLCYPYSWALLRLLGFFDQYLCPKIFDVIILGLILVPSPQPVLLNCSDSLAGKPQHQNFYQNVTRRPVLITLKLDLEIVLLSSTSMSESNASVIFRQCHFCRSTPDKLLSCSGCKRVYYCVRLVRVSLLHLSRSCILKTWMPTELAMSE